MMAMPVGTNFPPAVSEVQLLRQADAATLPPGFHLPRGAAPWDARGAVSRREDLLSSLTNVVRSERFFTAEVRARAAGALSGVKDSAATEALRFALLDSNPKVRFAAAAAISGTDTHVIEVLREGISLAQRDRIWRRGMEKLLEREDEAVITVIKRALSGGERGGRAEWLEVLAERNSKIPLAILPDLKAAFESGGLNPGERLHCAAALLPDSDVHAFLTTLCRLSEPVTAIRAAKRLLGAEPENEDATYRLFSIVTSEPQRGTPEGSVLQRRALAAEVLMRYGTEATKRVAADTLVKELQSRVPMVALRAAKILGADRPEAVEWFKGRLSASDSFDIERNEAVFALAAKYEPARRVAFELLHSNRLGLRVRAAQALGMGCQEAPESLLRLILVPDLNNRAAPEAAINAMLR